MSEASSAEQANKWAVRANEQTDERVAQYLRFGSFLFQTTVPWCPPPPSPLPSCSFLWSFAKWIQAALGPIVIFHQELDIFSSFFFHSFLWLAVLFPVCRFLLWGLFNYYLSVHLSFAWIHLFVCPSVFLTPLIVCFLNILKILYITNMVCNQNCNTKIYLSFFLYYIAILICCFFHNSSCISLIPLTLYSISCASLFLSLFSSLFPSLLPFPSSLPWY